MSRSAVELVNDLMGTPLSQLDSLIHHDAVLIESGGVFVDLTEIDDRRVLAVMQIRVQSRRTGASAEKRACEIYETTDDRIIRADIYYKDPATIDQLHAEASRDLAPESA